MAANQHAILIGIDEFARVEGDSAEGYGLAAVSNSLFNGLLWVCIQRTNTNVDTIDISRVANATVDDDALPAVLAGENCQLVADQGAAQGAAAVDYQYLAFAVLIENFANQGVVLKNLEGDDLAAERGAAPIALKHRCNYADGFAEFSFELVTEVWGLEAHCHLRNKKAVQSCTAFRGNGNGQTATSLCSSAKWSLVFSLLARSTVT